MEIYNRSATPEDSLPNESHLRYEVLEPYYTKVDKTEAKRIKRRINRYIRKCKKKHGRHPLFKVEYNINDTNTNIID